MSFTTVIRVDEGQWFDHIGSDYPIHVRVWNIEFCLFWTRWTGVEGEGNLWWGYSWLIRAHAGGNFLDRDVRVPGSQGKER